VKNTGLCIAVICATQHQPKRAIKVQSRVPNTPMHCSTRPKGSYCKCKSIPHIADRFGRMFMPVEGAEGCSLRLMPVASSALHKDDTSSGWSAGLCV